MKEVWKDIYFIDNGIIRDYRGLYQISNLGRVKSIKNKKILKTRKDKKGYIQVGLSKNNKLKTCKVHRLVAIMFIPNPNNYPQVHHKNEIKDCNIVNVNDLYGETTNLEWCTNEFNIKYSQSKKIIQYDLEGNFIKEYTGINEAMRETKISHICACCKGKRRVAGGYIWRYKEQARVRD